MSNNAYTPRRGYVPSLSDARVVREEAQRHFANRFFTAVFAIWLGAVVVFGGTTVNFGQTISLLQYALMVLFLFSFAFVFTKRLASLVVKPYRLPKLDRLARQPRVAILYTTMNDVVPECAVAIRQTYPVDVFLLDDSKDPFKRDVVDRIAADRGFRVLRRAERKGFKAGAINHWLSLYGQQYDYFVLLDADSVLPPDWVEHALLYADHPDNADLAIFQGLINIWNTDRRFPRALAPTQRIGQDEWEIKLAGHLGAVICYGHNVMFRTRHVLAVGGFEEGYVSEDFATAVRLASAGYGSTFVPLDTWEAMPENVRGFVKRQNKWTRGSMEFWSFVPPARIPWYKKLVLLNIPWNHVSYVAIMVALFLAVFGRISSFAAFLAFGENLLAAPIEYLWSIPLFRFILVFSVVTGFFTLLKLTQVRMGFFTFYRSRVLSKAIGSVMLPHELRSMITYLVSRNRRFPVTPKDEPPMTMGEILHVGRGTLAIMAGLSLGLLFWNPVGLWYNALWIAPFAWAPLVLYYYCGPGSAPHALASGGMRDLLGDPRLATAVNPRRNVW